jgi:hypothetical protein
MRCFATPLRNDLRVMIDFERFVEIARRVEAGANEVTVSHEVLGMSIETLTKEVLTLWGIPDTLVGSDELPQGCEISRRTRSLGYSCREAP